MVKENHEKFRETLLTFELHSTVGNPCHFDEIYCMENFNFEIRI